MKTLLLMRHAKSSWDNPDQVDHDRPLNARGRQAAPRMAHWLEQQALVPDLIVSSTAVRARETTQRMLTLWSNVSLQLQDQLYLAPPEHLAAAVRQFPAEYSRVLLVAHNPGLSDWLSELTGTERHFPTGAIAVLELPVENWADWNGAAPLPLIRFQTPKSLPAE